MLLAAAGGVATLGGTIEPLPYPEAMYSWGLTVRDAENEHADQIELARIWEHIHRLFPDVRREDHAQWLALWHAYNVFYGRSWGPNGEPPLFTDFTFDNLGVPRNPLNPVYAVAASHRAPGVLP